MALKRGVTRRRKNRTPNASGRSNENAYVNELLRSKRPKGQGKGILGASEHTKHYSSGTA